ncbi:hypothetical protein EXIGLDRAFT_835061 [Exidia glandulosa HHB12029]|uniref:F-box domain-containing protein n=1 Tax=Exidia glandulosa HHB12029 TaxID=1314781 RepID=A0A165J5R1_EXIGL|nr:hypothetical protein EXIGLDRAFT_835061 [Exidia glandulosa HHB12029]
MALRDNLAYALRLCAASSVAVIPRGALRERRASYAAAAIACVNVKLLRSIRARASVIMSMEFKTLSFDRLPSQVLRRVFTYLSLVDVIALSQTSSVLRTISIATADLWSRTRAYPSYPMDYTRRYRRPPKVTYDGPAPRVWNGILELLHRSRPVPARLALRVDVSRSYAAISNLLLAALQRSDELTLSLCGPNWTSLTSGSPPAIRRTQYLSCIGIVNIDGWLRVSSLLTNPAPSLRSFSLTVFDGSLTGSDFVRDPILPFDFLGGDAPCLRRLALRGITLPVSLPATLSQLVFFDYHPWPGLLTSGDVYTFLSHMPQLRTLGLTLRSFTIDPEDISPTDSRWKSCPHLLDVFVALTYTASADVFRAAILLLKDCMNVANVRMLLGGRWSPGRSLASARRNAPTMDALPDCMRSPEHFTIADGYVTIFSRGLHVMRYAGLQCMLGRGTTFVDFDRLTSLTLSELHWPETDDPGLAPTPSLTHLHIITASGDIFVSVLVAPWACDLLQELRFSYAPVTKTTLHLCTADCRPNCPHSSVGPTGSIALADVRRFISTNLQMSSHRMARVALAGFCVVVDPEPGLELLRLYEIADEVTLSNALEGIDGLKVPRRGGRSYSSVGDFYSGVYDGESRDDILRQDTSGTYT